VDFGESGLLNGQLYCVIFSGNSVVYQITFKMNLPHSHKTFEQKLYTHTGKTSNQNVISNKYSILIGQFRGTNTNIYSYSENLRDRLKMWQFFSNEVSFIWLRPPTHPLQMKVWKTEYRCIINQTPPNKIGFRTMYSPYACHDKGSIYESLSFQNHRHLISSKCTYNSTNILYQ
jgi:hypothetical protein